MEIIRYAGEAAKARLPNGEWVYRTDKFFLIDRGVFVKVAPYDNHFIYETKAKGNAYVCTCGSPAVITGYNVYKDDSSPTNELGIVPGELMLCFYHASFGKHADGSS